MTTTGREEFDILVARSGMPLSAEQKEAIFQGYGFVAGMASRIRTPRDLGAEPAHVFQAGVKG